MKRHLPILIILLSMLLAACGTPQASPTAQISPTPEASPTLAPTSTPTPPPGKAVLFAPDSTDPALLAQAQSLIEAQAGSAGLVTETLTLLEPGNFNAEVKLVVALSRPSNLPDLMAAAPQAQFIVVSSDALEPSANLTVIRLQAEYQAFVAGYLTTLISNDWRSGGLIPAETPALQDAFANGGRYFCGVCAPGWPLGATFPLASGAQAPADGGAWAVQAADFFDNGKVESFYLSAQAARPEVFAYLDGRAQLNTTVMLVGALPPADELRAQWAATIGLDPFDALSQALPEALAGKSAGSISVPVSLSDVSPDLLSPGRLEMVESLLDEIAAGRINPFSVPE
jgi:hypothetical protein